MALTRIDFDTFDWSSIKVGEKKEAGIGQNDWPWEKKYRVTLTSVESTRIHADDGNDLIFIMAELGIIESKYVPLVMFNMNSEVINWGCDEP